MFSSKETMGNITTDQGCRNERSIRGAGGEGGERGLKNKPRGWGFYEGRGHANFVLRLGGMGELKTPSAPSLVTLRTFLVDGYCLAAYLVNSV